MDSATYAREYDEMDHREVNARFVADLLTLEADLALVLDVGTGTALLPIELCQKEPSCRLVAIDLAAHMLSLARANIERAALAGVIAAERRDAKASGFADATFTAVISNSIVHHIPDPSLALAEMTRVLAPGGTLFVRDLARPTGDSNVSRLVATYAGRATPHQRALFDASLRASLTLQEVQALAARAGIDPAVVTMTSDRHWTLAWKKP